MAEVAVARQIPLDAQGPTRLRFYVVTPHGLCWHASAPLCNGRAASLPGFTGKYLVVYKERGARLQVPPDREWEERLKVIKQIQEGSPDAAARAQAHGVFSVAWAAPCVGGYCSRAVYDFITELLTLPKGFWLVQPNARGGFGPAQDPQAPATRALVSKFVELLSSKDRGLRITALLELAHIPGLARFLAEEERARVERIMRRSAPGPASPDELAEDRARQELRESMAREGQPGAAKR